MLFSEDNKGQGLVEYALILVLVAVVVIALLIILGPSIGQVFSNILKKIVSMSLSGSLLQGVHRLLIQALQAV